MNNPDRLVLKNRKIKVWLKRFAVDLGVLLALLLVIGLFFKNQIIFQPDKDIFSTPAEYGVFYSDFEVVTAKGRQLKGWHLPPPENGNRRAIIFFHGNNGNMSMLTDRLVLLNRLGFEVISLDWPGFGQSEGSHSEAALYEAAELAWDWAAGQRLKPENIIIYGFSLGGGAASYLAERHAPAALILDSTFTKLRDVPSASLPFLKPYFYLILGDSFNTAARLKNMQCPLLILHSIEDDVVPYALAEANYLSFNGASKLMAVGKGDHLGFSLNEKLYVEKIAELEKMIAGHTP